MATIFVLGHRGMLGHVVARYLAEKGHRVLTTDARFDPRTPLYVDSVAASAASVVINCVGAVKQKHTDESHLYALNTLLPVQLAMRLAPQQYLLHPSTDCVFSGLRGAYHIDDPHDAQDSYGISKSLGEIVTRRQRCVVVRTSIVGPELGSEPRALLGWFLRQGGPVSGFAHHRWNGVTTLYWSIVAEQWIRAGIPSGIVQMGSTAIDKDSLLRTFAKIFDHPIAIDRIDGDGAIDRTLVPTHVAPGIELQLQQLKAWYSNQDI
jgi:dTDP-4-dehydrorhamnose reductase